MTANVKLDRVILRHPSVCPNICRSTVVSINPPSLIQGSTAEIMFYGATVVSWRSISIYNNEPVERLFVSQKAAMDGSKPIRGGIPLVFPCFGAPTHPDHMKLPQHGYLRNVRWDFNSIVDNDAGVTLKLSTLVLSLTWTQLICVLQLWRLPRP